jgi:hypothetical protein
MEAFNISLEKQKLDTYAAYQVRNQTLSLGNRFWSLDNGDKLAALAHEYRHSRQNPWKFMSVALQRVLTGKGHEYGSQLEDEAFAYQYQVYEAIGASPVFIQHYLETRHLAPPCSVPLS